MSETFDRRLSDIFRAVFEIAPDADLEGVRQVTTTAWDSLGHVSLVTALESEFEVEISAADSLEITSFDAARLIVQELLEEKGV